MESISCGGITALLVLSFILSILGIVFIYYTIVGVLLGVIFLIISWIFFFAALVALIQNVATNGFKQQSTWCKINIIICTIIFLIYLVEIILSAVYKPPTE